MCSKSINPSENGEVRSFTFDFNSNELRVLDQLLLPESIHYVKVPDCAKGYEVIKSMMVRGAPCIAAVGCLSLLAELGSLPVNEKSPAELIEWLEIRSRILISARPTAVNLRNALSKIVEYVKELASRDIMTQTSILASINQLCSRAMTNGIETNKRLAEFGVDEVLRVCKNREAVTVLTHCNTGALATVGHGTALGVVRTLHYRGVLEHVYCTETRPYNQGSRLTAWELVRENIPSTLIADNMVAYLMATRHIDAVLVGADCVASNGDTANKIGTLQLAVVASHYQVPFYVIAPTQSLDLSIENQQGIEVEQRPANELKKIGSIKLAPDEIGAWNPCFDITPGNLITKIVTELGSSDASRIKILAEQTTKPLIGLDALF